jgi:putative aldouronate transport system substrate-binding protein
MIHKKSLGAAALACILGTLYCGCSPRKPAVEETTAAPGALREKETVVLDVFMMASAGKEGSPDVVDAINAYLGEKLNVKINLTFVSYGNYVQQTNLVLSAGQGVDILPIYMVPLFTVANNGQIIPLDDLLAQYGQGIVEQMGKEYIDCGRINNVLFGLPTGRDLASAYGFEMRKDICDKYGIDYANITTLDQLHDALTVVHRNEPNLICVVPSNGELVRNWGWDPLGDMVTPIGVLMDRGQNWDVVNLFETDFYRDFVTTMRRWYLEGLIMQDAISNSESVGVMMGAGKAFGGFMNLKPYFEVQETTNYGTEIVVSTIVPPFAITSYVIMNAWAISSSCKNPAAAMKLLNLMYTDPTLMNLMIYGIEGKHYIKTGEAGNGQSIIAYPPGIDGTTTQYRPSGGWLWGNQFVGHVWQGNPPDYWDVTRRFNETALKSYAFGFSWDSSDVKNQLTACVNVMGKYHKALMAGAVDPVTTLPRFIEEMKSSGVDDIVADKQAKLNAWRAGLGK